MNALQFEKSPYLLQHATNPVDWHPWGEEAFRKARDGRKPIFLSIGYSTCHWCHVMEHESFEDVQVASLMNETFVSIKVDREERPDVDAHYMTACQLMTGSGGWPLTIVMTPEGTPFFAGTYFPKESGFGHVGMLDLVPRIRELWETRRDELVSSGATVAAALAEEAQRPAQEAAFDRSTVINAARAVAARFDPAHGGFGSAPKFPMASVYPLLLRSGKREGNERTLGMVESSLMAMRNGGIYDQVGFGFHRYSTDAEWRVPHFEKMLYDQALLCMAYVDAWQATGKDFYRANGAGDLRVRAPRHELTRGRVFHRGGRRQRRGGGEVLPLDTGGDRGSPVNGRAAGSSTSATRPRAMGSSSSTGTLHSRPFPTTLRERSSGGGLPGSGLPGMTRSFRIGTVS